MISNKQIIEAINRRCITAMKRAGYKNPTIDSIENSKPNRPCCMVLCETVNGTCEIGNNAERNFQITIQFFPKDESKPYRELRDMDDWLFRALMNPIICDGYTLLPESLSNKVDTQYDVLMCTALYTVDIPWEEIELDTTDEYTMENIFLG